MGEVGGGCGQRGWGGRRWDGVGRDGSEEMRWGQGDGVGDGFTGDGVGGVGVRGR